MVIKKGGIKFECPYCNEKYETYGEANDCAEECNNRSYTEPREIVEDFFFVCEYCKKPFNEEKWAEECEINHENKKDKFYEKHEQKVIRDKLKKAANHPNQKIIKEWS